MFYYNPFDANVVQNIIKKVRNDRASSFDAKVVFIFPAGRCICQEIANAINLGNLTIMVNLSIFAVRYQHRHLTRV